MYVRDSKFSNTAHRTLRLVTLVLCLGVLTPTQAAAPLVPTRPAHLQAHPDAVDIALGCLCQTHPNRKACKEARRADVAEVVADLLWVIDQRETQVPARFRPILVAVACGEGGFSNYPTCGGDPGCNDSGTSGGMFQFKLRGGLQRLHQRLYDEPLDVHDHLQAGLYYLDRLIYGVRKNVPRACGHMSLKDRWNVAAYRLGRGPMVQPSRKARTVCAPDLNNNGQEVCRTIPSQPAIPRCDPNSRYARWSVSWYRRAPEAWSLQDTSIVTE
jgi:hypothetical protein